LEREKKEKQKRGKKMGKGVKTLPISSRGVVLESGEGLEISYGEGGKKEEKGGD